VREYLLTLLVAAAVSYLLTPLVRRGAMAFGAVPEVRDRDVHAVPTPTLGGLAMYGGLAAGLLVASQLPIMRGVLVGRSAISLLLAGALIVATGVVDDRWGMNATSKLAAQVGASGILIWGGVELAWLPVPKSTIVLSPAEGAALTILLVVATINAVNFIDGLDGLAAGIVGIAAFAFFIYSYEITRMVGGESHLTLPALSSAVLTGMCAGFLPHNFFPARIFMGDTGAMLIGLVLAYGPVASSDNLDPSTLTHVNRFPTILPLLLPVAILVIPYADLILAVVRRTRAGLPWNAADKKHLHHRLLDIGHSHRQSVLIMYAWAALFAFAVVMLGVVRSPLIVFSAATLGALLALLLVSMPRLRPAWLAGGGPASRRHVRHGTPPGTNSHRPRISHRAQDSQADRPAAGPSAKVLPRACDTFHEQASDCYRQPVSDH
jgi:UDP-GlcNAc:undecaprenyl-phosphate/decaprenyl-phosphate GlcNAc-1-phosphate transferase